MIMEEIVKKYPRQIKKVINGEAEIFEFDDLSGDFMDLIEDRIPEWINETLISEALCAGIFSK